MSSQSDSREWERLRDLCSRQHLWAADAAAAVALGERLGVVVTVRRELLNAAEPPAVRVPPRPARRRRTARPQQSATLEAV